ncbi:MAG: hypothetical protein HUJ98_03415 [Bacteroidaceae bacterium]|nr:hypothetical protein [Bacteroidaceae bacterium]
MIFSESQLNGETFQIVGRMACKKDKNNADFGLVFNYLDSCNYWLLSISKTEKNFDDIINSDGLILKLVQVSGGIHELKHQETITSNINTGKAYNLYSVAFDGDSTLFVLAGAKRLKQVFKFAGFHASVGSNVGIYANKAKVTIERFIKREEESCFMYLQTSYDEQSLINAIHSTDANAGFWKYLDRDIEEKSLKLGGRYRIALVPALNGYDIIYVDGAQVNAGKWKPGMLKGRLINTKIAMSYDLVWYDSSAKPFTLDVYAEMDGGVLTLHFPAQKSQIRFIKE